MHLYTQNQRKIEKFDRLAKKYKKNLDSILINPFNHNSWRSNINLSFTKISY